MKLQLTSIGLLGGLLLAACGGGDGTSATTDTTDPMERETADDARDDDDLVEAVDNDADDVFVDAVEPSSDPDDQDPEAEPEDTTAPTVLEVLPEDGATGVFAEDVIVIEFAEPMDQEATEAAYSSEDLPSEDVTFAWNEAGTVLTITPNEPLVYAIGFDPDVLQARRYSFTLTDGAQDLAGNALEAEVESSFDTGRMFLTVGELAPFGYGALNMDTGDLISTLRAGDTDTAECYRGFASFVLPELPDNRLRMLVAFETAQTGVNGEPFEKLTNETGTLALAEGIFNSAETIAGIGIDDPIAYLSEEAALGPRSVDVTSVVEPLFDEGAENAQFVFQFVSETDGDDAEDSVLFDANSTRLVIAYLLD